MRANEATIGVRVRSLVEFSGVPKGTEGLIDEDYGSGVIVAWDLPDNPLPEGYILAVTRGVPLLVFGGPLRDGFDKENELQYLEVV